MVRAFRVSSAALAERRLAGVTCLFIYLYGLVRAPPARVSFHDG